MVNKNTKASKKKKKANDRQSKEKKRARAQARADKQREKTKQIEMLPTANARMISKMLKEDKIKGNFKDFVIISGNRLINWKGTFNIVVEGDGALASAVVLIHKSKLANIIGEEEAKRFWHPKFGRLVEVPEGTKPTAKD